MWTLKGRISVPGLPAFPSFTVVWTIIFSPNHQRWLCNGTIHTLGMTIPGEWSISHQTKVESGVWLFVGSRDLSRLLQEVQLTGACNGKGAALHAEFAVNMGQIPFNRCNREEELVGDFAIGKSIGNHRQHRQFPLTQRFDQSITRLRCLAGQYSVFRNEEFI